MFVSVPVSVLMSRRCSAGEHVCMSEYVLKLRNKYSKYINVFVMYIYNYIKSHT